MTTSYRPQRASYSYFYAPSASTATTVSTRSAPSMRRHSSGGAPRTTPPPASGYYTKAGPPRSDSRSGGYYSSVRASRPPLAPYNYASNSSMPPKYGESSTRSTARSSTTQSSVSSAPRSASRSSLRKPRDSFDARTHQRSNSLKHVRFAGEAEPRPALKSASTWHAGDATPYPLYIPLDLSPRAAASEPPAPVQMQLHPLFAYSHWRHATVSWDVTRAPTSLSVFDRRSRTTVPAQTLSQPATTPPTPTNARLVFTSHKFPWAVAVCPSPAAAGGRRTAPRSTPITNLDVLHAVHTTLAKPATADEWAALGAGSAAQKKVRAAFEARCARGDGRGREGGLLRVDWLCGKTRLVGIEMDKGAGGATTGKLVFAYPKE